MLSWKSIGLTGERHRVLQEPVGRRYVTERKCGGPLLSISSATIVKKGAKTEYELRVPSQHGTALTLSSKSIRIIIAILMGMNKPIDHDHFAEQFSSVLRHRTLKSSNGSRQDQASSWGALKLQFLHQLRAAYEADEVAESLRLLRSFCDMLEAQPTGLKGLLDVHSFVCEHLQQLACDGRIDAGHRRAAAMLFGQTMGMSPLCLEGVTHAIDSLSRRGDPISGTVLLCVLLGAGEKRTDCLKKHITVLLNTIQAVAFMQDMGCDVARAAVLAGMKLFLPDEKPFLGRLILQTTHTLLSASLKLCNSSARRSLGAVWCCNLIVDCPMILRRNLRERFPQTCDPRLIFQTLQAVFTTGDPLVQSALCSALPILTTWETGLFCKGQELPLAVDFMLSLRGPSEMYGLDGLGNIATVVLDKFEPFLDVVGDRALEVLARSRDDEHRRCAQTLLARLLTGLGPMAMDIVIRYLQCDSDTLLADVRLLEMIAILLPTLAQRITQRLSDIIDDLMSTGGSPRRISAVLDALSCFPLDDPQLAEKVQRLVLWCLDEDRPADAVMSALQLSTNPFVASLSNVRALTLKAAQLLLADDPHVVHVALSVLSDPMLASTLDERSCSMILLALHQSLEPSIQIVAAKLLTHLTTAHRAIVQPLAWLHIRQSLSLMDFLRTVDSTRAIIEACIISNLLPALPTNVHKKYVEPIKELILSGLQQPNEGHTLSLIFQGLANLAKFEDWGSGHQNQLVLDLLEMSQEIPKDSQHASLKAISRLLSVPREGIDVYDLLVSVHATFGSKNVSLDMDLKALVAEVYGHLGTVERNPVISRDSRAAIDRERLLYNSHIVLRSQAAEARDRSGSLKQYHINHLVTKTLISALSSGSRQSEDRDEVLAAMACLGILQPSAISDLIPDLPSIFMDDLRAALGWSEGLKDFAPLSLGLVFLAAALHSSPAWLHEYWTRAAKMMAATITAGGALPVLKGVRVMIDTVKE